MIDYKDWIQERACELAEEDYGMDFYDLPTNLADEVCNRVEVDYTDYYSGLIDAAYDRWRDEQIFELFESAYIKE